MPRRLSGILAQSSPIPNTLAPPGCDREIEMRNDGNGSVGGQELGCGTARVVMWTEWAIASRAVSVQLLFEPIN
jgi:hypothetical protein